MPIAAFRRLSLLLPALCLLALCLLALSASAEETGFIAEIDDLPLMPGLAEVEGAGVVFDKPSGRIVEAYARGAVTREAVASFYRDTLPQLGWSETAGLTFAREGESLAIEFLPEESSHDGSSPAQSSPTESSPDGGPLTLRFTLKPE